MAVDRKRLEMFRQMWIDELESADLYRTLAETSEDDRRRPVLYALAASEDRHAGHWERVLREYGVTDLRRPPTSARTRVMSFLARRFGAKAVLPFVLRLEAADAAKYREVAEAPDDMADEELAHGRVMVALGGAPAGEQIARSEGRHRAAAGGALRAAVFGMNDGLVSNLLLVLGVAGGTSQRSFLLLAGLAGLLAGAFSMAAGEWVSVQSQRELYEREIAVEAEELAAFPEEELEELALIYQAKGLSEDEAQALAKRLMRKQDAALDTLAREELGLAVDDLGSPWVAAGSSFGSFAVGAFIPVLPFLFSSGAAALVGACLLSAVTLLAVGAAIALLTGRGALRGGLRMVAIAATVGVVSHVLGRLIGAGISA